MKQLNPLLAVSGIILFLFNFFIIYSYGIIESRWTRFASILLFFILYLKVSPSKEKFLITAFGLFVVSDLVLIHYEIPWVKKMKFMLVILAYASLFMHIRPYVRKLKTNLLQKSVFISVLAINTVMLFLLVDMVKPKIDDAIHSFLFYLYGVSMIGLVTMAFSYSHRYSNRSSFYFICAVLGFIFSDISGFIAYYMDLQEFYFPDRFFYLAALACLVIFAKVDKEEGRMHNPELI